MNHPVPTHLKVIRGNPGKRALSRDEPEPQPGVPPMPKSLSKGAQACWKQVAEELDKVGVLTVLDEKALVLFAESYATWREATDHVRKKGLLVKTALGFYQQHPALGIANKAQEQMLALLREFGMTPSSRTRVKIAPGRKKANRFSTIAGGKD